MKFLASRLTKMIVGVFSLAVLLGGLTACSSNVASYSEEYLVVANVQGIDCPKAADDREVLVSELQETAVFVDGANSMQTSEIIALNEGITSLEPLSAVLNEKIEECGNSEATATSTSASSEECDPLYKQVAVSNDGNKVDAFFQEMATTAIAMPGNVDDNLRGALLERAGQSGQLLAIWSSSVGLYENPNDWQKLVEGDCLSEEGQRLHTQFEGVLTSSNLAIGEAPENGYNSGVSDGTFGVSAGAGIRGDRTAVVITLRDGTNVHIMTRCGNVVYEGKPPLPTVPTDNPPPPPPPETTTPPTSDAKDPRKDVTPPQGTTILGPGTLQPVAPAPKAEPLNPTTPVVADPGPAVPVQGATPAPVPAVPAPTIPQAPTPESPGTPITDPDG